MKNPKLCNLSEIAEIVGVERRTVASRLKNIEPAVDRGTGGKYWRFPDVVQYFEDQLFEHTTENRDAKERKMLADAVLAEIEVAEKRSQLAQMQDVEHEIEQMVTVIRSAMLNIPKKLSPILATIDDINECTDILEREIYECLSELSTGFDTIEQADQRDAQKMADDVETSAEVDDQRMGRPLS